MRSRKIVPLRNRSCDRLSEICGSPCRQEVKLLMNNSGSFWLRRILCILAALFCFRVISTPAWTQFETRAYNAFAEGAYSITTGDFNHDGKLDVVMMVINGFAVALGNGDGAFQKPVTYATKLSRSLAVADFNNDGNLDIVSADGDTPGTVSVYLGNGDGTFKTPLVSRTTNPNASVVLETRGVLKEIGRAHV